MNWKATPSRIEIAATSIAAACLGGAVGFAVARIGPLGAGVVEAIVAGCLAALAGWILIGQVDRHRRLELIVSAASPEGEVTDEDVLLLDQFVKDETLLPNGALPVLRDDSRVVRLFGAHPVGVGPATPLTGPGEMIARIEEFLCQPRGSAVITKPERGAGRAAADDASAALHVALADIRRSLRQA